MTKYLLAFGTAFLGICSQEAFAEASGCILLDGKTYNVSLTSMPIDPDVAVGTVLYTERLDTTGPKLTCPLNSSRGKYNSKMLGNFTTVTGTNAYGNIYATGIAGIGIQIRDLVQSAKSVPYSTSMNSGELLYWQTDKKTVVSFIKTGPVGTGKSKTGQAAQFMLDDWMIAKIAVNVSFSWITKSCVAEPNSRIQNIQLGKPSAKSFTSIGSTSEDKTFSVKLKCKEDAVPVYVSFEPTTGSSGTGLLNIDSSVDGAASGVVVEVLNGGDRTPLAFDTDKKYHTAAEQTIEIPLIARYKRTGTVVPGTANAAMTFTINQY